MTARYVIDSASLGQVDAWYQRALPPNAPWQSWTACSDRGVVTNQHLFANEGTQRTWVFPGRMLTLETSGANKGPVTIFLEEVIGYGASGGVCPSRA